MKKNNLLRFCLMLTFGIAFCFNSFAQISLIFDKAIPSSAKVRSYRFESGDVIYFPDQRNTGNNNPCNSRTNWVRLNSFTLELKSTSASSLVIYGKSGATTERTVIKVETSNKRNGTYTDITENTTIESGIYGSSCGEIILSGLNVRKGDFLRITFSTVQDNRNVLVSEISVEK